MEEIGGETRGEARALCFCKRKDIYKLGNCPFPSPFLIPLPSEGFLLGKRWRRCGKYIFFVASQIHKKKSKAGQTQKKNHPF